MSTRRARIKAVAALPPRRKNGDIAEGSKIKQLSSKESLENVLKSPKTPRPYAGKVHEVREKILTATKSSTNDPFPLLPKTPNRIELSNVKIGTSLETQIDNSVKNPVTASVPGSQTTSSIFASPLTSSSLDCRLNVSPIPSKTAFDGQNSVAAQIKKHLSTQNVIKKSELDKPSSNTNEIIKLAPSNMEKKSDIPDDYSVPSVPESITDEAVMDGIVPLESACNAPKPLDLLKNQIISENAEVLFDPIVPLPSPSKVRPKLRPVPRLAPHRRNSIQGSASESEDESRRAMLNSGASAAAPPRQRHDSHTSHSTMHSVLNREVNRIRNDSVCSSASQATVQPPPATSPVKEKHVSKSRRQEMSRRMWRRRRETVKRDALTMYDLIFYNPTTNPLIPDQEELKAKEANAKEEEAEKRANMQESEEEVDEPPAPSDAPVPQIKLGPNGEIMLDEKSLVIKQSDANRKVSRVVREGTWAGSGGGRYSRAPRTAEWSAAETVRFYRALAAIGTDFTLMAPLFPDRSRKDLKLKFKKEERLNGAQVDMALRSATSWDAERLQGEFREERAEAARKAESDRQRLLDDKKAERERLRASKDLRVRTSLGSKALESIADHNSYTEMTADDFVNRAMKTRSRRPKRQTLDVLPQPSVPEATATPPAPTASFATLTLLQKNASEQLNRSSSSSDMATISRVDPNSVNQFVNANEISGVPSNIETGSLVVLRVNDSSSPTQTILQTYIAHGDGKLTPVALPSTFLNSVVGYMQKGKAKSTMSGNSSPQLTSPASVASMDSQAGTPTVIKINPSPAKRQRHSSYTITQL